MNYEFYRNSAVTAAFLIYSFIYKKISAYVYREMVKPILLCHCFLSKSHYFFHLVSSFILISNGEYSYFDVSIDFIQTKTKSVLLKTRKTLKFDG